MAVNRFDTARQQQEVGLQTINTFAALPVGMIDQVLKRKQGDIDKITSDVSDTEAAAATIKARVADEWVKKDIIKDVSSSIDDFYTKHGSDIGSQQAQMDWSKLKSGFLNNEKVNNVVKLYNQQEEVDKKRLAMDDANTVKFHEAWKDETAFNTDGSLKEGFTSTDIGAETRLDTHAKQQQYFQAVKASGGEWGKMASLLDSGEGLAKDFLAMHMVDGKLSTEGNINKIISADGIGKANQAVDNYLTSKEGVQQVKAFTHEALKKAGYSGIRDMQLGKVPEDVLKRINDEARKEVYYDMFNTSNEFRNTQSKYDENVIGQRPQEQVAGNGIGGKELDGINRPSTVDVAVDTNVVDEKYPELGGQPEDTSLLGNTAAFLLGVSPTGLGNSGTGKETLTIDEQIRRSTMGVVALAVPLNEDGTSNSASKLPVFDRAVHVALGKNGLIRKGDAVYNIKTGKLATPIETTKVDADARLVFDGIKQITNKQNIPKVELLKETVEGNVSMLLNTKDLTLKTALHKGKKIVLSNDQLMLLAAVGTKGMEGGDLTAEKILSMKTEDVSEQLDALMDTEGHPYKGKGKNQIMKEYVILPQTANSVYLTGEFTGASSLTLNGVEIAVQGYEAVGNKQTPKQGVTKEQHSYYSDMRGQTKVTEASGKDMNIVYVDKTGKQSATPLIRLAGDGSNTHMKKEYKKEEVISVLGKMYDYDIENGLPAKTVDNAVPKAEYMVMAVTQPDGTTKVTNLVRPIVFEYDNDKQVFTPRVIINGKASTTEEYENNVGFINASKRIADVTSNHRHRNTDGTTGIDSRGYSGTQAHLADEMSSKLVSTPTYIGQQQPKLTGNKQTPATKPK